MGGTHRSFRAQTLHYFGRPHSGAPSGPIGGAAAWTAKALQDDQTWRTTFTDAEVDEVRRAVEASYRSNKPMREWTADDFPLPELTKRMVQWRSELSCGRGVRVIRGTPTHEWSQEDAERFFWGFGLNLGAPGAQNPGGDLLGHVTDLRESGDIRLYRTASPIRFHCDAADVVGLLCLRTAKSGGRSRIASSVAIFDELMRRRPELAGALFEPFAMDAFGGQGLRWFALRPSRYHGGRLRTFYHSDYLRSAQRHADAPRLSAEQAALLDAFDELAADPAFCVEMDLQPGDVQLLSNHTVVHARTGYEDHDAPERRRHLLRLWLSIEGSGSWADRALRTGAYAGMVGELVKRRLAERVRPAPPARP